MNGFQGWTVVLVIMATGACDSPGKGTRATGAPCAWGLQCEGEVCIGTTLGGEPTGWTAGMCTERCLDGLCSAGQICTDLGDGLYCLPGCSQDGDCRDGYVCNPAIEACLPDCTLGWDCGGDHLCEADGVCWVNWPELDPVGSPCVQDASCRDAWCLEEDAIDGPTGWIGGACTVPCGPGGHCPPDAGCMVIEGQGWCLPRCVPPGEGSPCRDGYVCDPFMHVCIPSCLNDGWNCGEIYECREDGVCGPVPPPGR